MTSKNQLEPAETALDMQGAVIPLDQLHEFHQNPRKGDVSAIAASLETNGQYKPIVVNRGTHTGRPMEVLAGNHTLQAARSLDWPAIDAVVVDVDEQTATRIVVADNRIFDLGGWERAKLNELIGALEDIEGTGVDLRPPRPDPTRFDEDPQGLKIGREWILATDEEWAVLVERFEAYADEQGTLFGIIALMVSEAKGRLA